MVINGQELFYKAPIKDMFQEKMSVHGTSFGLSEAGYDIRIKQTVRFRPVTGGGFVTEIFEGNDLGNRLHWEGGKFGLASAMEEFQMPDHLMGIVHDKSTWARRGLSVFNTVIEPGWKGFLTLELIYHRNSELIIPAGAGIAQVIFHDLSSLASYNGKYQNQEDRPVAARESV